MKSLLLCIGLAVFTGHGTALGQLWDNGKHDGRPGFLSLRHQWTENMDSWAADDFAVEKPWRISSASAEFFVDLQGYEPFELADIAIWRQPTPGKEPGPLVVELRNLPIEWEQVGEGSGLPIISARVSNLDIALPPGDYYFGMRLVADNLHGAYSWLCTTGSGAIKGWNGGWSWWNHPPRWTSVVWYLSKPLRSRLATSDFAFSLYGERL